MNTANSEQTGLSIYAHKNKTNAYIYKDFLYKEVMLADVSWQQIYTSLVFIS